jgi:hypothetical protein
MDPKIWNPVLNVIGVVIAIAIPLMFLLRGRKKRWKTLEALTAGLGGQLKTGLLTGNYVRLNSAAGEVRLKLMPGDVHGSTYLEYQQMTPLGFNLSIAQANAATRTLERMGLFKEVKVGDPRFDDQYLIRGSDPDRVMGFLREPGRREAIEHFFRNGFVLIQANPHGLIAQKHQFQNSDFEPSRVREYLERLGRLAGKP